MYLAMNLQTFPVLQTEDFCSGKDGKPSAAFVSPARQSGVVKLLPYKPARMSSFAGVVTEDTCNLVRRNVTLIGAFSYTNNVRDHPAKPVMFAGLYGVRYLRRQVVISR